jgi:hypothetical protein
MLKYFKRFINVLSGILLLNILVIDTIYSQNPSNIIKIPKTEDFSITGTGSSNNWLETEWINLTQRSNHENSKGLQTSIKVLYSDTGL